MKLHQAWRAYTGEPSDRALWVLARSLAFVSLGLCPVYAWLLVAMGLAGFANGVYHPADYAILSAHMDEARMGRAFSIHTFAGFVGGVSGIWGPPTVIYLTAVGTPKIEQLDELFLLVVVGEFNAGKSAFINALLGQRVNVMILEKALTLELTHYRQRMTDVILQTRALTTGYSITLDTGEQVTPEIGLGLAAIVLGVLSLAFGTP